MSHDPWNDPLRPDPVSRPNSATMLVGGLAAAAVLCAVVFILLPFSVAGLGFLGAASQRQTAAADGAGQDEHSTVYTPQAVSGTQIGGVSPPDGAKRVFYDEFKNWDNGWQHQRDQQGLAASEGELGQNGYVYTIRHDAVGWYWWSFPQEFVKIPQDFYIQTSARQSSGAQDGGYGLVYNVGLSGDNWVALLITSNGYFEVVRKDEGVEIVKVPWKRLDAIKASGWNVLVIRRQDDHAWFYINGVQAYDTPDSVTPTRSAGIIANVEDSTTHDFVFKDYAIYDLSD